jgi:hypothetical protein
MTTPGDVNSTWPHRQSGRPLRDRSHFAEMARWPSAPGATNSARSRILHVEQARDPAQRAIAVRRAQHSLGGQRGLVSDAGSYLVDVDITGRWPWSGAARLCPSRSPAWCAIRNGCSCR